ncbi:MAG: hypothetical protein JWO57_1694 [Pseudonocardiales bacterium]|nr:hypothetical protein [Pseudonocardiales bacterium]
MTTTVKGVTARKRHRCDEASRTGLHFIEPGHRYLRHVAFPGDDVNGSDQPWVLRVCIACAEDRDCHAGMLVGGACTTFCCAMVPCALPFKHAGDRHSCLRCTADTVATAATR